MALRLLRLVNHWFALAAFWGYLAAVALAFTMVVVFFPVGALALLFAGLLLLPVVVGIATGMGFWERAWCRRWLRAARCPNCLAVDAVALIDASGSAAAIDASSPGGAASAPPDDDRRCGDEERASYECRRCGACFAASGAAAESPLTA